MKHLFPVLITLFTGITLLLPPAENYRNNSSSEELTFIADDSTSIAIPLEFLLDIAIAENVDRIVTKRSNPSVLEQSKKLTDEEIVEILNRYDCPLINRMGKRGLELMRENFKRKARISGRQYSSAANSLCVNLSEDGGRQDNGKLKVLPYNSVALSELPGDLYMSCWPSKFHTKEDKEKILQRKSYQADTIAPVLVKLFSKYLNCYDGGPGHNAGHMFKSIFDQRLFVIADYLIEGIEKELGPEYTLTLDDISTPEDRDFIKEELCKFIPGDERFVEDKKRYLKKFYGITSCE